MRDTIGRVSPDQRAIKRAPKELGRRLYAAFLIVATTAQAPPPDAISTPPATTSADCPRPQTDTHAFVSATALEIQTPRGALSLVPVADENSRARGLMCVVHVPRDRGMLFVFTPPDRAQGFWMKNTLVPLDMVFIAGDGRVTTIAPNVPATPSGTADAAVARRTGLGRYVIELGSGDAARHGIVKGIKLTLPSVTAK